MTESPEQRVARLEAELAAAKVDALQKELAAAQGRSSQPAGPGGAPVQIIKRPDSIIRVYRPGGDADWAARLPQSSTSAGDTRLAPAPRPVPFGYRAMAVPFSTWALFALFMIAVTPIALYIFLPISAVIIAAGTFLVVLVRLLRKSATRNALLKWGEVASVTNTDVLARGTYYSGTTVQNVRMAQAHGWQIERQWYSGPVTKTRISYELNGKPGSLVLRGLEYDAGIILADSRNPHRALCVSSFPYDLDRDANGNWTGAVAVRMKLGSLAMVALLLGWTFAMCYLWGRSAADLPGLVRK
jgi:hypothetical protein